MPLPLAPACAALRNRLILTLGLVWCACVCAQEKAPDMSKPVKVFILLGDIAMYGTGDVGPEDKPGTLMQLTRQGKKYPALLGPTGEWSVRNDVRFIQTGEGKTREQLVINNWLSVRGSSIGPEIGFGHVMGDLIDEPVLLIKCCEPSRNLGWDLLPPGALSYEHEGKFHAGYRDTPAIWETDKPKIPMGLDWYGGKQYDLDVENAKKILSRIPELFPGSKGHHIAGFLWWQGYKDTYTQVYCARYEFNLALLISALRSDFDVPKAPFVIATFGCGGWQNATAKILAEAQLAVGNPALHPGFAGNVTTIESRGFWRDEKVSPRSAAQFYNRNAETTMEVGLAMGHAMAKLLGLPAK